MKMTPFPYEAVVLWLVALLCLDTALADEFDPVLEERYEEAAVLLQSQDESDLWAAAHLLKELSLEGYGRAQYTLGLLYQNGWGVQKNENQAKQWHERSAETGYPMAMLSLAEMILEREEGAPDYERARALLETLMDPKSSDRIATSEFGMYRDAKARGNYLLGLIYSNGWSVEKDEGAAVDYFTRASLGGDKDATTYLAVAYAKGDVMERDIAKSKEYFELLDLQSADEMNRRIEESFGRVADGGDLANMEEASELLGQYVSNSVHALQTEFARDVLTSEEEDFDASFAAALLKMAADGGFSEAEARLGVLYWQGLGVNQDGAKAEELFRKAAAKDWMLAQYNLACVLDADSEQTRVDWRSPSYALLEKAASQGLFVAQARLDGEASYGVMDPEKARDLCLEKAEEEDPRALYSLAIRQRSGWMVEPAEDFDSIVALLEKSAETGYKRAQYMLGYLHLTGNGVEPDYQAGFSWLRSAAFQELPEALAFMGDCYAQGIGVPQDYGAAFRYYSKAVRLGLDNAKNKLALFYRRGVHVPRDEGKAALLYLEAADHGDAEAARNVAICYLEGYGVSSDLKEGMRWLAKSAELGNLAACFQLAHIYEEDLLVDRDPVEVAYWLERAAEMGDKGSMKRTAFNYYMGAGMPKNRGKALQWLQLYEQHPAPIDINDLYYPEEYEGHDVVRSLLPRDYSMLLLSANLRAETGWSGSNPAQAAAIYDDLTQAGSFGAALRLADLYLRGLGREANPRRGHQMLKNIFQRAKDAAFEGERKWAAVAARKIGRCYEEGAGVRASSSKRLDWLEVASNLGDVAAQTELGLMLAMGEAGKRKKSEGVSWLMLAARSGEAKAQLHLAQLNLSSPIESLSERDIIAWLKALVDRGSGEAQILLRRYGVEYKDFRRREIEGEEEERNPWVPVKAA